MLGLPCKHSLLPVPSVNSQGGVSHELAKLIGMVKDTLPERVYGAAHIIDVNSGNILVEKKLKSNRRAAGIRFYILAVEEVVRFHQALDVSG